MERSNSSPKQMRHRRLRPMGDLKEQGSPLFLMTMKSVIAKKFKWRMIPLNLKKP
jgi:hypothetical protein